MTITIIDDDNDNDVIIIVIVVSMIIDTDYIDEILNYDTTIKIKMMT